MSSMVSNWMGERGGHKLGVPLIHVTIIINREMLKKSSFQELMHQIGQYLAWSIPWTSRFKLFILNKVHGVKNDHTLWGQKFM